MPYQLEIHASFPCNVNDLFSAWSSPELLERWFFAGGWAEETDNDIRVEAVTPAAEQLLDARDPLDGGGDLQPGEEYLHSCEYLEVVRPVRISYVWRSPTVKESTVTVSFTAGDSGSEVALLHEGFDTAELRDVHRETWEENLKRLKSLLLSLCQLN
jgi:uncharacterized protein YndB with AHSA1/START domain